MGVPLAAAGIAVALALVAGGLLYARPSSRAAQLLAALLVLRAGATLASGATAGADDATQAAAWARIGAWYAIAAPPLILGLGVALFEPPRAWRLAAPALVGASLLGLVAFALEPALFVRGVAAQGPRFVVSSGPWLYALAVLVAACEALVVWWALAASRGASDVDQARARWAGFAFALLPSHAAAFFLGFVAVRPDALADPLFTFRAAGTILAGALCLAAALRLLRGERALLATIGGLAVLGVADAAVAARPALFTVVPGYEGSVLALRLAFALAMGVAAVRYGMLDAGAAARRRALGGATLALAGALGAALLLATLAALGANALGVGVGMLAAVGAPALAWRRLREASDRFVLPPDDPRAVAARARAYASALAAARGSTEGERLLRDLRADLGISEREHEMMAEGLASRESAPYRAIETLGEGATATVELARDEATGARVVVKRFRRLRDPEAALAEARALAAVRHPRIVPFLEVDRRGDEMRIVLAHAEGGSARQLLDREGPLAPARAAALARDLLEGLAALHEAGLVHCDVKAENLLLDAQGRGMLADFGSARFTAPDLADATLTGAGAQGSLSTISPEALRGAAPAPARDVYAAGAVLYRLLTGEHYVDLKDATVFEARERITLDPPRLPHPRVPSALEPVLRKALQKQPELRYASAREMLQAL